MGPFPHDAPRAAITKANPAGTDGFYCVEFAHPAPDEAPALFARMGFTLTARHKTKAVELWQQGDITHILTDESASHARRFAEEHGPCAPAMGWRVVDAKHALDHAVTNGATPHTAADKIPARHRGDRRVADLLRRSPRRGRNPASQAMTNRWTNWPATAS